MKRLLLLSTFVSSLAFASAQCTPDNTISQPGVYPEQPDTAFADQEYDFSFQVLALRDTAVVFAGQNLTATIDSVKVNNVIGLPNGFNYTCNPTNCTFTWQSVGCVNVKGNPTQAQVGVYDLKIATTAYARAGILALPVPDTADGYQLIIKGDGSASIFDVHSSTINVYPNPSKNGIFLISSAQPLDVLSVLDIQGKEVDYETITNHSAFSIFLIGAPSGIYFMRARVGSQIVTKKLVR